MKVLFTFAEISAIESVSDDLVTQLAAAIPNLKGKGQKTSLAELLDAQQRTPELVAVDLSSGTVTITVPEELVVESTKIVGVFYSEIIELVPMVMVLGRMLKKVMSRYEASVAELGAKFSKLVKPTAA